MYVYWVEATYTAGAYQTFMPAKRQHCIKILTEVRRLVLWSFFILENKSNEYIDPKYLSQNKKNNYAWKKVCIKFQPTLAFDEMRTPYASGREICVPT